jgi:hypothetical protein
MSYFQKDLGTTLVASYAYPGLSGFTSSGGVCKPTSSATKSRFVDLQKQVNRVLKMQRKSAIAVDGLIGPNTVKAVNSALSAYYKSCSGVANSVLTITAQARSKADGSSSSGWSLSSILGKPPTTTTTATPVKITGGSGAKEEESGFLTGLKASFKFLTDPLLAAQQRPQLPVTTHATPPIKMGGQYRTPIIIGSVAVAAIAGYMLLKRS